MPQAQHRPIFANRRWLLCGVWLTLAVALCGCEVLGIGTEKPKPDTVFADPCDDEPYGEGCPCVDDPAQDFCPDPCSLEPPAAQCSDAAVGDTSQDAKGADAADGDAKAEVKVDTQPDSKDSQDSNGSDQGDASAAEVDDQEPADAETGSDGDELPDLQSDDAEVIDTAPDLGPPLLPDAILLADGASVPIPPEAQWDVLPGDGDSSAGGAIYLPDGLVLPVAGEKDPCKTDDDCVGPNKSCQLLRCVAGAGGSKACQYVADQDGVACTDGNACSDGDSCHKGVCQGWTKTCADKDGQHCTITSCDPVKGCVTTNAKNDTPCNDGNACTDEDACYYGKCKPGSVNKCECNKASDCLAFDDGNLCNGEVKCVSGTCVTDSNSVVWFDKVGSILCDPTGDTACLVNQCNPKNGACEKKPATNGSACSDGDACSVADQCQGGQCIGSGGKRSCDDNNLCTSDSCDAKKGCQHKAVVYLCDDGNSCTIGDLCIDGQCKGEMQSSCTCASDADCTAKNDANLCNGTLKCIGGACQIAASSVVQCPPSTPCSLNSCDPATGKCNSVNQQAGLLCQDGDACTLGDSCDSAGVCKGKFAVVCNDGNPCTADSCSPLFGCVSAPTTAPCNDGDGCSGPDQCQNGLCQPGPNLCSCKSDDDCTAVAAADKCKGMWYCDTNNNSCKYDGDKVPACAGDAKKPCLLTACNPLTGQCSTASLPENSPCDDGLYCSVLDRCLKGQCSGDDNPCSDGLACTSDSCDESAATTAEACKHDGSAVDKLPCDDGSLCTTDEVCTGGYCVGKPGTCDDKNPCTVDSCDKGLGCTYLAADKGTSCDDGNACTGDLGKAGMTQDGCSGFGKCDGGAAKTCTSDNPCIEIPCNPTATSAQVGSSLGCEQKVPLNGKACDDGNACTGNDLCQVGLCAPGTETGCDDGNSCTTDACEPKAGCTHSDSTAGCDDQDACTEKDTCANAVCKGQPNTCDDENVCTADSCKAGSGCINAKTTGDCGSFAACSSTDQPVCEFKGGAHVLISEIYLGTAGDPNDDWVEIYNPTDKFAKLEEFQLEARPLDAQPKAAWTVLAKGKPGALLAPKGYALFSRSTLLQNGVLTDTASPTLDLEMALASPESAADCLTDSKRHLQLRLRDPLHQLEHDRVAWHDGQPAQVPKGLSPIDASQEAWPRFASVERKATALSDANTMYQHKAEWLAGNSKDTDSDAEDFVVRWWPEPQSQSSGKYEPACGGYCGVTKVCNFKAGADSCTEDLECKSFGASAATACGPGKVCGQGLAQCVPDPLGTVLVSEVYFGADGEQYIELYNASAKTINASGWKLQRKNAENEPYTPWIVTLSTLPAGTVLPPKRYLVVATQSWARTHGQTDVVVPVAMVEAKGGALRLWDPASDAEVDLMGWGNAKAYSNASTGPMYKAAVEPKLGQSLERKAKPTSKSSTMAPGGGDDLAGNAADSANDSVDFVVSEPSPQSLGSGVYEPACSGTCPAGLVCNFATSGSQLCIDPLCGVPCDLGLGCNPKTGACDLKLLLAEVTTEGGQATDQNGQALIPAANEYVVLYNPSPSTIQLAKLETVNGVKQITDALVLQVQGTSSTSWKTVTDSDVKKKPLSGGVAPYSYYLLAPAQHDGTLPPPDYLSAVPWNMDGTAGAVRLARLQGSYSWGNGELDRLAWGAAKANDGEGKTSVATQVSKICSTGQGGALRRLAVVGGKAEIADPFSGVFFAGAGKDSNDNAADWSRVSLRRPRSQKCSQPADVGAESGFCVGYPVAQRP